MDERYFLSERQRMVEDQFVKRDIYDERVLEAMLATPRHRFIPPEYQHMAYADCPLPIGHNQTISQPYIVALMTQMLQLGGREIVLEIGTGSGYQAAVLSLLAREVHTIERYSDLASSAAEILGALGIANVYFHVGDGSRGWVENAPYQGIIATAAAPRVPPPLLEQLDNGGRLVLPVGGRGAQYLERWIRQGEDNSREKIAPVAFVPMLGEFGWADDAWEWV
jgi:protein-L-isoaspartate(D-aspartate) O-methyltransferase